MHSVGMFTRSRTIKVEPTLASTSSLFTPAGQTRRALGLGLGASSPSWRVSGWVGGWVN